MPGSATVAEAGGAGEELEEVAGELVGLFSVVLDAGAVRALCRTPDTETGDTLLAVVVVVVVVIVVESDGEVETGGEAVEVDGDDGCVVGAV